MEGSLSRFAFVGVLAAALAGTACVEAEPLFVRGFGNPVALDAVSGNGQRGEPNTRLLQPFVVEVTDNAGEGVPGIIVNWARTLGPGELSSVETLTNASGLTSVFLTLGGAEGQVRVQARVTGLLGSPVTFAATAVLPTAIVKTNGDGQTGQTGEQLSQPLEVRITASDGGPVPGVAVNWRVSGDGSVMPTAEDTDVDGRVAAVLTLGSTTGTYTITASVTDAPALVTEFTAEAN